ncbi:MAG: kelch repeat-containing protein [Candidatus Caldarchaeum sp.]
MAEARMRVPGKIVNKVGRTTGWSQGPIVYTCVNLPVYREGVDTGLTLICQDGVQATSQEGDSGSPVFSITNGSDVILYGLLWGGNGATFFYSPIENIQRELGLLRISPILFSHILWRSMRPMPTPRAWSPAVVEGGKIYVVGGVSSPIARQFYNAVSTLEVYDPERDTWQILAPMRMPRVGPAVAAFGGKIYVFGGFNRDTWSTNPFVEIYDIATNTWSWGPRMPTPRSWARAVVLDGRIYVIGGVGYGYLRTVEVYDPVHNRWIQESPLPARERYLHAAVAYNGKIYVIGGDSWNSGYQEVWDDLLEYDPVTKIWSPKTRLPFPATGLDAVAIGGKIYVFGDLKRRSDGQNILLIYDILTDEWTEVLSSHSSDDSSSTALWNRTIFRFGGGGWGPTKGIVEAAEIPGDDLWMKREDIASGVRCGIRRSLGTARRVVGRSRSCLREHA